MNEQKPSICRNVVYHHSGSKDGKFPPKFSPGIIQGVNEDGTVNMVVFSSGSGNGIFFANNVKQVDPESTTETGWSFPPRV